MSPHSVVGRRRALVLAAHGSRRERTANALVRRVAEDLRRHRIFDEVAVAFHQGEPGFDAVLDELDADEITVVPLFTSAGYYSDVVLPQALARNHRYGELRLRQTPAVGTHAGIGALIARRVAELMRTRGIDRSSVSLALVGHGTPRHAQSRSSTLQLVETLRRRRVAGEVLAAFLDDDPPVESLLTTTALRHLIVVPFLMGGAHVTSDLPRLLGSDALKSRVILDDPVGSYSGLADIIIDLARRHAPPPPRRFRPRLVRAVGSPSKGAARQPGTVNLVGGGPGDPGLITVRGLDLLRQADVVIHDRLIGSDLLREARTDAVLIDAGKGPGHAAYSQAELNGLLVEHARAGNSVVRLKGGDPFVFGRGSEEVAACRHAGVRVRVVPGVTSAIAGPAAAGIPVTARGVARSFTVVTGHTTEDTEASSAAAASAATSDTLVIMMGRANLGDLAARLIAEGREASTPAACIQSATTANQRVTRATLATIAEAADRDGLESPVITVVGNVVALASHLEQGEGSPAVVSAGDRAVM